MHSTPIAMYRFTVTEKSCDEKRMNFAEKLVHYVSHRSPFPRIESIVD